LIGGEAALERQRQERRALTGCTVATAGRRAQVREVGLTLADGLTQQAAKGGGGNAIAEPETMEELISNRRGAARRPGEPPVEGRLAGSGDREELAGRSRAVDLDAAVHEPARRELVEDPVHLPEMERGKAEGRGGEQAAQAVAVHFGVCGDVAEDQIGNVG
jgi:hypothetical protein